MGQMQVTGVLNQLKNLGGRGLAISGMRDSGILLHNMCVLLRREVQLPLVYDDERCLKRSFSLPDSSPLIHRTGLHGVGIILYNDENRDLRILEIVCFLHFLIQSRTLDPHRMSVAD